MALLMHYVNTGKFTVDGNGVRIDKSSGNATINQMLHTSMADLVIPDVAVPNSMGYPMVRTYLALEAISGYELRHMDQSIIVTYFR